MSENHDGMTAAILGATGAVGKKLLTTLLEAPEYATVHSFGRRSTGVTHPKLQEHTVDFEALCAEAESNSEGTESAKLRAVQADSVFITLGTTRAQAGSFAKFERIDREYVLAAAKAALDRSKPNQQLMYCSSAGGTSSSPFTYPKSKGLTEEGLANLAYPQTFIVRPGMLQNAQREDNRIMERVASVFVRVVLEPITDSAAMDVKDVARAMYRAAVLGSAGLKQHGWGQTPTGRGFHAPDGTRTVTALDNATMKKVAASQ